MSPDVRADVKSFLRDTQRGRLRQQKILASSAQEAEQQEVEAVEREQTVTEGLTEEDQLGIGYIDRERRNTAHDDIEEDASPVSLEENQDRMVDVVLSDMSAPWEQTTGFFRRSLSDPYRRLMNTSGNNFRDLAGSMVSDGLYTSPQH